MEATAFHLLWVQKYISLNKNSEIKAYLLCLRNISTDFSTDNGKKIGWNGYVYDSSVDYNAIAIDDMLDIHKYLIKKHDIIYCLDF